MRKGIAAAQHHPTHRTIEDFRVYWQEVHGPLGANMTGLRRYVQHLTLAEAYRTEPTPNFDGVSMFWIDGLGIAASESAEPTVLELQRAVRDDDVQLFDRTPGWPAHRKQAMVIADEHVVVDGATTPEMVKALFIVGKLPGLSLNGFFEHWGSHHAALTAEVPGLRRYVQNHAVREAYAAGNMTHDGFAELWFDDLAALTRAAASPEWAAAKADAATLFGPNVGVVVAREFVQKEFDWTYHDWGVRGLDEGQIRQRLRTDGYLGLAEDADAPRQIKAAAEKGALALWTRLHLVTIDESKIDARPNGASEGGPRSSARSIRDVGQHPAFSDAGAMTADGEGT